VLNTGDQQARAKAAVLPHAALPKKNAMLEMRALNQVWHFFTLTKLALALILVIALFVLIGTLLEQAPPGVRADAASYQEWLARARGKYGFWTDIFDRLQFFNVFSSLFFRVLVGLLAINTIVCTINRWKSIWTQTFHTRVRMGDSFFQHARFNATFESALPASEAAQQVGRAFSKSRYRVKNDAAPGSVALFADKNRLTRFGTFLTHIGIVLILAGTVVGNMWGFKDNQFVVPEGMAAPLGQNTNLSLKLDHFADRWDAASGGPTDYASDVVLYENGKEVKSATIRVNSPLRYKGIAFHQAFYGQTALMKVEDGSGKVLFEQPVALAWQSRDGNRPLGNFQLTQQNLDVWVFGPRSGENDPLVKAGEMRVEVYRGNTRVASPENLTQGTSKELVKDMGLTFTFLREGRFTGLKVVKDPGVNIIWAASGLMVFGMMMLFWLPRRRVWAIAKELPGGGSEVRIGMPAQRDLSLAGEFDGLRAKVGKALGVKDAGGDSNEEEGGKHV
jgi:cytochrome c biogenesis protein